MNSKLSPLFCAPNYPWPSFRAIDDRVRGGSSISNWSIQQDLGVFSGNLDIKTLGGAGFASQATTFTPALNWAESAGLSLLVINSPLTTPTSPTSFTLTLKNVTPDDRLDGRKESVINFEYTFDTAKLNYGEKGQIEILMKWNEFIATYRGRQDKSGISLDPKNITELSFMSRSGFGKQEGQFKLNIQSLSLIPGGSTVTTVPTKSSFYDGFTLFFSSIWSSIIYLFTPNSGNVRLP